MFTVARCRQAALSITLAALTGACADQSITGPDPAGLSPEASLARKLSSPTSATTAGPVCETITFDNQGWRHGSTVSTVSLTTLGITLAVRTDPYRTDEGAANPYLLPRTYSTDNTSGYEDVDLQYAGSWEPPVGDGRTARCPSCRGLGNVLVIEDERGFTPWGDSRFGGQIIFSGFPTGSGYYINSFNAVDDDREEPAIQLRIDGTVVAASSGLGDGTVELVSVPTHTISSQFSFEFGTLAVDGVTGSGAIDNIEICRPGTSGNVGTGTPGYWKNHPEAWPVEAITIGGITYTKSEAIAIMNTPVRGDMRIQMFYHLVAAKLNVLNGTDASCISATIAEADAWMARYTPFSRPKIASSSAAWTTGAPLHARLVDYNEGKLCAPSRG